ncbi:MAG TPA: phosphate ABC transporter permease PtsA, partial [Ruminococcaceae bacterium]|nr:phosphate ABC transporter permease PtsA [Oscillospiraceae bacterium]
MEQINKQTVRQKLKSYRKSPLSLVLFLLVTLSAVITAFVLFFLIAYILVNGVPHLTPELFSWTYNSENVSMLPSIVNTFLMTLLSLIIATPMGIFSAIYLVEYAKRGSKIVKAVRITAETLSGIPSIVYGLFGMLFFVVTLHWGYSILSGAFTLAIMILPLIMRTTEEALKSVPDSYREGSFGLGAGRLRTVFRIVLPSAVPGILAGVILAIGRIVGETAALIFTAGTVPEIPESLFDSARTL